ncbi:M28 family peptidase [Bizionia sediminis]|uniref:M28 family peptidase n=1 Tax=Bizionia sediminis TaxID=1737064 RepID=A0ABW5KT82_9FLAO
MTQVTKLFTVFFFLVAFTFTSAQTYNTFYGNTVNQVSASNILNDLTTFENFGTKQIGQNALTATKDWLVSRYQSLGYTAIEEQPFSVSGTTAHNIIITKTGSLYPDTYVIIDAHYDTINGPGTNDNGSGTVLLLEMARLLANINTEYSIKFIHFSGEELGLIGSEYFVNNTVIPEDLDIKVVFNIDQVGGVNGTTNNRIYCEEDRSAPWNNNAASALATQTLATCMALYSTLNTEISYAYGSDYVPFQNNGNIITGLYEKNESPYSHSPQDLLENMDPNYLYQVTRGALGAALEFAVATNPLGVKSTLFTNGITITPNPATNYVNITIANELQKNALITIYNVAGNAVYNSTPTSAKQTVDVSRLQRGFYLITVQNGLQKTTKKLVLK